MDGFSQRIEGATTPTAMNMWARCATAGYGFAAQVRVKAVKRGVTSLSCVMGRAVEFDSTVSVVFQAR